MDVAEEPVKREVDPLEGAGEGLIEVLVGVGAGARQLAGQVIGHAVTVKTGDEPDPESEPRPGVADPTPGKGVLTRATKSLKQILDERRKKEQEEGIEELEDLEGDHRGVAQQALERYERDMEQAQLSRKRTQEAKEAEDAKRLKRSERHRRRGELADEQYRKEEEERRKAKEAQAEQERVWREQDALLRKAQTLVQHEKNQPGRSTVIALGDDAGGEEEMWLPDVVIFEKDSETATKFRHKKGKTASASGKVPQEEQIEEEEEEEDDDEETGVDMNDPDIIKLAGCAHAKNIKTAQAYEHYM